ncbi:MAG: hypothetical protein ACYDBS_12095 [Acidimicrobiales bacterium]
MTSGAYWWKTCDVNGRASLELQKAKSRFLGVNCDPHAAFLAAVEDGAVVADLPERLKPPEGMELGDRLLEFIDEVRRALGKVGPSRIGLLQPESGKHQPPYRSVTARATIETLVRVAAAQEGVPVDLLARATVRALLDLPKKGTLDGHVEAGIGAPIGKYWTTGRGLAALAARAVEVHSATAR